MIIEKTFIDGLLIITPDIFSDERGFFFESYNADRYRLNGIEENFVQDNISKSVYGTIRGLHYQIGEFAQSKLCQVIEGNVLDVAVDIRFGSPTFGKWFSIELSAENKRQFWIPAGFAHGFSVLSDHAVFMYKCTNFYNKKNERTIFYNDPVLGINWSVEKTIVSTKDNEGILFNNIAQDFLYKKNNRSAEGK